MSQTVSFQCGKCHKAMGVTSAYLGKQVRCPHCKEVVTAPAQAPAPSAPAPAPAPTFTAPAPSPFGGGLNFSSGPPSRDEHESIFGEQVVDDLFDAAPKPKIELPPEPAPNLQLEPTMFQMPSLPPTVTLPSPSDPGPTMTVPSPSGYSPSPPPGPPSQPATEWSGTSPTAAAGTDGAAQMPPPVARMPTRPTDSTSTTLLWYLLYILAGYALLMTIVALYYWSQAGKGPHPMEILPDPGAPGSKSGKSSSQVIERISPVAALPDKLKLNLGETLTLGDLEVTPVKVEQKIIRYDFRTGMQSSPSEREALVLHLKLKNVSENTFFRPTDCSFDYKWKEETDPSKSSMPYTYLAANGHYYAGPTPWKPNAPGTRIKAGDNLRNEFIDGQKDDEKILKPGEEVSTVIVTDPEDDVPDKIRDFNDKLEWRVQLRRGFVPYEGKNISCTAVIGVKFDKSQIEKK